jgi:hypothetical protein
VTTATGQRVIQTDRVGPLVFGGLAVVGLAVLSVRNPNVAGSYGACPFRAVTGWDCPFCGGLRGTYALIHGDVATALDHNVLLPLLLGGGVVGLVAWWRRGGNRERAGAAANWPNWVYSRAVLLTLAAVLATFWVVRNIPAFSYLASPAS